jgi:hypothetical protein
MPHLQQQQWWSIPKLPLYPMFQWVSSIVFFSDFGVHHLAYIPKWDLIVLKNTDYIPIYRTGFFGITRYIILFVLRYSSKPSRDPGEQQEKKEPFSF